MRCSSVSFYFIANFKIHYYSLLLKTDKHKLMRMMQH